MATIADIGVVPVLAPLPRPLTTASGATTQAPLVLIDVAADDGTVGHAYLFAYRADVLTALAAVVDAVAGPLIGQPVAPRDAVTTRRRDFALLGTPGFVDMALAGLDVALWDLLARTLGVPLASLLGGAPAQVHAYASHGMDGVRAAAEAAADSAAQGFDAVKVKIGYPTVDEDLAVIRAVRAEMGDAAAIMVDYNQSLDRGEAMRRCRLLDHAGLEWIEEPLRHDDFEGHARLADAITTPLQLGENCWGRADVTAMLNARASDLAMLDLAKAGGVSGWLDSTAVCEAAGMPVSSHFYQEVSVHLLGVGASPHYLEFFGVADVVLAEPLSAAAGFACASQRPGTGVEWDTDAVARFAVRR